jgi:hypothetical protein
LVNLSPYPRGKTGDMDRYVGVKWRLIIASFEK